MKTADRIAQIQPFHVMELARRAGELEAQGRDIVHMELGEPDFSTPEPIIEAGINALKSGITHYTTARGLRALREAISRHYHDFYGVDISPRQVILTPGSSGALQLAMALLVNPGQSVMMTEPGYPCNPNILRLMGGQPQMVAANAESAYQPTPEILKENWRDDTAALLVGSPSNPTGSLIPEDVTRALAEMLEEFNGGLMVDEIYHGLTYGKPAETALKVADQAVVINSFSKYFGMTGWRLGWMVVPESVTQDVEKLAQNLFIAPSTIAQQAALAAFLPETQEILQQRRAEFERRRDFLYQALIDLGFGIPFKPEGAFYIYANCEKFSQDSMQFSRMLLEEYGVSITPGIDFGENQSNIHVRFAFTTSMSQLEKGVDRLANALT